MQPPPNSTFSSYKHAPVRSGSNSIRFYNGFNYTSGGLMGMASTYCSLDAGRGDTKPGRLRLAFTDRRRTRWPELPKSRATQVSDWYWYAACRSFATATVPSTQVCCTRLHACQVEGGEVDRVEADGSVLHQGGMTFSGQSSREQGECTLVVEVARHI